jgi:hypothetical protein
MHLPLLEYDAAQSLSYLSFDHQLPSESLSHPFEIPENFCEFEMISSEERKVFQIVGQDMDRLWCPPENEISREASVDLRQYQTKSYPPKAHKPRRTRKRKRTLFSFKEDLILAKYYRIHGKNWTEISNYFDGRSPATIKNRFYQFLRDGKTIEALLFLVDGFEQEDDVEKFPEEILIPFKQFIPKESEAKDTKNEVK